MDPIKVIRGELDRLESALHHKPLTPEKVDLHLRRLDRIRAELVRLDPLLRQACGHDGILLGSPQETQHEPLNFHR